MNINILREHYLSFLEFTYPDVEGLVYDFMINGYKIQEKIHKKQDQSYYKFELSKNKFRKKTPYEHGDNNYYWLHIDNERHFYIIPEKILVHHGYLTCDEKRGKFNITLYPKETVENMKKRRIKTFWAQDYLFDYQNLDIHIISNLFHHEKNIL